MKVGDYVRYNLTEVYGVVTEVRIAKIERIIDTDYKQKFLFFDDDNGEYEDKIIKSSSNIIDLIEIGDLVKIKYYSLRYDERVERLFEVTYKDKKYLNLENSKCDFMLINGDFAKHDKDLEPIIKSIVTKVQFESMEYKL